MLKNEDLNGVSDANSYQEETSDENIPGITAAEMKDSIQQILAGGAPMSEKMEGIRNVYACDKTGKPRNRAWLRNWFLIMCAFTMQSVLNQMKRISKMTVDAWDCLRFLFTIYVLEGMSEYDTMLVEKFNHDYGDRYPISDYLIDSRLSELVPYSRVSFPGDETQTRNLIFLNARRLHDDFPMIRPMTPSEFSLFQTRVANLMKSQPNFVKLIDYKRTGSITDSIIYAQGGYCHLDDLPSVMKLPVYLRGNLAEVLYKSDFFTYKVEEVVRKTFNNTFAKY